MPFDSDAVVRDSKELETELQAYLSLTDGSVNPMDAELNCEDEAAALATDIEHVAGKSGELAVDSKPQASFNNPSTSQVKPDFVHDLQLVSKASEHIIVGPTRQEYERQWDQFITFCAARGYIESAESFIAECTAGHISPNTPIWIVVWIMKKCDKTDINTGKVEYLRSVPKYGTAQKMRAALSHKFGRDFGRGEQQWTESQVLPGTFLGNPSVSQTVANYMTSLQRAKVKEGEVPVSAQAITADILRRLWEYNNNPAHNFPNDSDADPPPTKRKRYNDSSANQPVDEWLASHSFRRMLHLVYVLAFLCLLRFDEALRIEWGWINFHERDGEHVLELRLPYRKTHQTGDIAPFFLYENKQNKPWLCPIEAYTQWAVLVPVEFSRGFMFRRKVNGSWSRDINAGLSAESFLDCFRNNLIDIDIDPRPYGTHSFRRGGCQHLAMELRWPFREICAWGGWAENFDSPGTIFKYLLSYVDTPTTRRQDYFNPSRQKADPCSVCGRSCWCA